MHTTRSAVFWALFTVVNSVAFAVLALSVLRGDLTLGTAAIMSVIVGTLELTPVYVQSDVKTSLSVIVLFVAIAIGGLSLAVVLALTTGLLSGLTAHGNRAIKASFNTGMDVVTASVASVIFATVTGVDVWSPSSQLLLSRPLYLTAGLLAAGLAYSVLNAALMSAAVHAIHGMSFAHTFADMARGVLLLQFVYVGLAAIAYVLLVRVGPVPLVLLVVPLAVARSSLLSVQQQQDAFDKMVRTFVKAIELKDGYTRGHAERVSDLSVMVAESMGLSYDERQLIRYGAILHDVGKIGVSLGILCKAGPLTDDEFAEMRLHPEIGAEMLADIDFLQPALAIVRHHHERIDGRGYPAGLAGEGIPLLTRVVTAVDAFDAMTSTRSYRRALPVSVALEELQANAGSQFDTEVVEHLVAVIDEHGWEITDEPVAVTLQPQQVSS